MSKQQRDAIDQTLRNTWGESLTFGHDPLLPWRRLCARLRRTVNPLASELARRSCTRAISVDFPLAPEHPYPAAVHQAVGAFQALLDDGTPAEDIILAGESSGGGLALAAIQAAIPTGLPRPAAIYVA